MTNEPAQPEALSSAHASHGAEPHPVERMISANARRIAELSASMCASDGTIQGFQKRLAELEAETARIAAFVDQMHRGAYFSGGSPKRPVLRVIRGDRDHPPIVTFVVRATARLLGQRLSLRPALAALLGGARRHTHRGLGSAL